MGIGNCGVARDEPGRHTAVGDFDVVGVNAHRQILGQLVGEQVEGGLHTLARQRHTQSGDLEDVQLQVAVDRLGPDRHTAQRTVDLQGAVTRTGGDATDQAADQRDHARHRFA